jgi:glutathione synthase/RimK-type ligase-like ATP-grasp enzyme
MTTAPSSFIVGWLEWLTLPELGLPAIKAKIDTGARTSALHAFQIETFGPASQPMVRFGVHPIPGRLDVVVTCSAPVIDRREVTSSNGERETRYFIRTPVSLGGRTWPIEIGLTNRESMAYRMLLGRQAIREDMMVDAAGAYRQPRLSYKLYRGMPRLERVQRALRIALVARQADAPFNRRLARAAAARGHVLEPLELDRLSLTFDDDVPGLALDGAPLAHYDAVVPRVGRVEGVMGAAIVRQLEARGSLALNSGDALDRAGNRLAVAQMLARERLPQDLHHAQGSAGPPAIGAGMMRRVLVVGHAAVALLTHDGKSWQAEPLARHRSTRRLAERAAAVLELGLVGIDITEVDARLAVCRVDPRPLLARIGRATGTDVTGAIVEAVEAGLRARGLEED